MIKFLLLIASLLLFPMTALFGQTTPAQYGSSLVSAPSNDLMGISLPVGEVRTLSGLVGEPP
jgi:hypothetical protein